MGFGIEFVIIPSRCTLISFCFPNRTHAQSTSRSARQDGAVSRAKGAIGLPVTVASIAAARRSPLPLPVVVGLAPLRPKSKLLCSPVSDLSSTPYQSPSREAAVVVVVGGGRATMAISWCLFFFLLFLCSLPATDILYHAEKLELVLPKSTSKMSCLTESLSCRISQLTAGPQPR